MPVCLTGGFPLCNQETTYRRARRPFFRLVVRTVRIGPCAPPPGAIVCRLAVVNACQGIDDFFAEDRVFGMVISANQRIHHPVIVEVTHSPERHIGDRKSTRLNSRHYCEYRMPSYA